MAAAKGKRDKMVFSKRGSGICYTVFSFFVFLKEEVVRMLIAKFASSQVPEELSKIESQYQITFPESYRNFLYRYNGGNTPRTKFRAKKISSDVKGFYGLGKVKLPVDQEMLEKWIPQKLFPIACDSFGNLIVLCIAGDRYGNVFFCDHEKGMSPALLADSFSSFLQACKSDRIPEAARRSIEERKAALMERGRESVITPALIEMWQKEIDKYGNMIQEEVVI